MSSGSRPVSTAPPAKRPTVTLSKLAEKKALGEPIVMITAYDYPSAQVAEAAGVDVVLVGDSGAMTVLGYPSTVPVTIDGEALLAVAAEVGGVRLIDNTLLTVNPSVAAGRHHR